MNRFADGRNVTIQITETCNLSIAYLQTNHGSIFS